MKNSQKTLFSSLGHLSRVMKSIVASMEPWLGVGEGSRYLEMR